MNEKNKIELPRCKDGKYYTSYSQINDWNSAKGFSTGLKGKQEFILKYFAGINFPDTAGFAQFGNEVENYILNREDSDKFTDEEKETLDKIQKLDLHQHEIMIPFEGFYVKGFIDDMSNDYTWIRDYKTASLNSSKKYYEDDYKQLDFYALGIRAATGVLPSKLEVCAIERLGNGFRGGRDVMSVGKEIWYIDRKTDEARLKELEEYIVKTVHEISDYYKVYKQLNK